LAGVHRRGGLRLAIPVGARGEQHFSAISVELREEAPQNPNKSAKNVPFSWESLHGWKQD